MAHHSIDPDLANSMLPLWMGSQEWTLHTSTSFPSPPTKDQAYHTERDSEWRRWRACRLSRHPSPIKENLKKCGPKRREKHHRSSLPNPLLKLDKPAEKERRISQVVQSSNIRPQESDSDSDAPLLRRVYNRLILQIYTILPQRAHPLWMLNSTLNFSVSHQLAGMKSCPRSSLRALDEQHGTIRPALPLMKTTRTRLELATSESERRWPPNKHAGKLKKGRDDADGNSFPSPGCWQEPADCKIDNIIGRTLPKTGRTRIRPNDSDAPLLRKASLSAPATGTTEIWHPLATSKFPINILTS